MALSDKTLTERISTNGIEGLNRFYGVYFGIVKSNEDPQNRNRVIVYVPEVFGPTQSYALASPRGIIAGKDYGFHYVPIVGETVIITFRRGDPRFPVWEPGFWAKDERPEEFSHSEMVGFKSRSGHLVTFDDKEALIYIKHSDGTEIKIEVDKLSFGRDVQVELTDDAMTIGKDKKYHFTLAEELQDWLNDLVDILLDPKLIIASGGIGKVNTPNDINLTDLKLKLNNILSKF